MKQAFTIGVFGIIKDEQDRVLSVLRNDYDLWNLPGGGLEDGKTPWQGVVREVKEETGYDVEVVKLAKIYIPDHISYHKDETVHIKHKGGKFIYFSYYTTNKELRYSSYMLL